MATYRISCRVCGGPLHVISGKFHTPFMPLTGDGFSFSEAKQLDTEEEEVHCEHCDFQVPLADYTLRCADCEDAGWIHSEGNEGLTVERCDVCAKYADDDNARAAHTIDCGCGWGADWYHQLYVVTVTVTVAAAPDQSADIQTIIERVVQTDLPGLVINLPAGGRMHVCGAETASSATADEHPSRTQLIELSVLDDDDEEP